MVGSSLSPGQTIGNIAAFIMPLSFAILILIIRKYPNVDMVPIQLIAGIIAMIIGYLVAGKILVSVYDIYLGFLAGFFQLGFGFILITIGARRTPSALVGIIMLTEAVLGPFWACFAPISVLRAAFSTSFGPFFFESWPLEWV